MSPNTLAPDEALVRRASDRNFETIKRVARDGRPGHIVVQRPGGRWALEQITRRWAREHLLDYFIWSLDRLAPKDSAEAAQPKQLH